VFGRGDTIEIEKLSTSNSISRKSGDKNYLKILANLVRMGKFYQFSSSWVLDIGEKHDVCTFFDESKIVDSLFIFFYTI